VPEIVADGIQIQQVLLNLISNPIHSVNASGSSNRRSLSGPVFQEGEIVVDVGDTGIGISDASRSSRRPSLGMKKHGHRPCNLPDDHRRTWWRSRCRPIETKAAFASAFEAIAQLETAGAQCWLGEEAKSQ
jgi:hypothetical protein